MTKMRDAILGEMGLGPIWKLRDKPAAILPEPVEGQVDTAPVHAEQLVAAEDSPEQGHDDRSVQIANMDWDEIAQSVAACRACGLCQARKQAVLGVGDVEADWLFVGEGPGAEEDERGEPFVGQAGKLLDAMLAAIDIKRGKDVYIANAVKCRPPNNRTPEPEETNACWPYLQRQIALIQPKLIVALGRPAAQTLLGREVKIGASRGQLFEHQGIPLIVSYHPAYLLRNLPDKAKVWEDLVFARRTMRDLKLSDR
ncbi:MAG: uracil-DNA glycosylase [Georgfuchsia sp.]